MFVWDLTAGDHFHPEGCQCILRFDGFNNAKQDTFRVTWIHYCDDHDGRFGVGFDLPAYGSVRRVDLLTVALQGNFG